MSLTTIAAISLIACGQVESRGQVDLDEVLRLGNTVQKIDGIQSSPIADFVSVMSPPPDDNHKWFITLVTMKGCPMCVRLKADFVRDPYLRALVNVREPKKSWSHFNVYRIEDKSQKFRWKGIKFAGFPTILVQPPLNKKYGDPAIVVFQHAGYDGNGQKLANKLTSTIKQYLVKRLEKGPINQGGHRQKVPPEDEDEPYGIEPPWNPSPKVDPLPDVGPLIDLPQIPPLKKDPKPKINTIGNSDAYPEAIVITDADDGMDEERSGRIRRVIEALRKQRGKNLKIRLMDWRDAKERYPVARDEVPVILVTQGDRITDKISGRLLPFLNPDGRREVGITDLPWGAVITLITTGFSVPAILALVIWVLRFIRSRRKAAGANLLLSDDNLERIFSLVDQFIDRDADPPAKPRAKPQAQPAAKPAPKRRRAKK